MRSFTITEDAMGLLLESVVKAVVMTVDLLSCDEVEVDGGGGGGKSLDGGGEQVDPLDAPHVRALMAEMGDLRSQVNAIMGSSGKPDPVSVKRPNARAGD